MSARLLDGAALASSLRVKLASRAADLRRQGMVPTLAVVLVGDDPASAVYVRAKSKAAIEAGVEPVDHRLPATTELAELLALIDRLNRDAAIDGILVQLPLPRHLDTDAVIQAIDPAKDVDGLHPLNLGLLAQGKPRFIPCTPRGCMHLLAHAQVELAGAHAVVLGRSVLVGKPMALLLSNANATVTLCHSHTKNLERELQHADVVVAAIGRAHVVSAAWLSPQATVIDVGINRGADGKLTGDVSPSAAARVAALTPVPRGVGPMTIACLLENTIDACVRLKRPSF